MSTLQDRIPLSQFDEVIVTERSPIVELRSNVSSVSALRNVTTVVGSATVTASNSEYVLATTAAANDDAILDSAERGRYMPGYSAQVGIGIRYAGTPAGETVVKWGAFDTNNGFYFGRDADGIFIAYLKGGSETKVYQSAWNTDTLSATGENPSGLRLNLAEGNIFHITYSWYGYGSVVYSVVMADSDGKQHEIDVHHFSPTQTISVEEPNLPIRVQVSNGATATAHTVYVGGRQFSIVGKFVPVRRDVSERRLALGSVSTTVLPLIGFRRKAAFASTSVKIDGFDLITDQPVVVEIRTSPTSVTAASWGTPTNHTASECAVESDIAGTAISGGIVLWSGLVAAGGAGATRSGFASTEVLPQDFIGTDAVYICARKAGSTDATVSCVFRVAEEW